MNPVLERWLGLLSWLTLWGVSLSLLAAAVVFAPTQPFVFPRDTDALFGSVLFLAAACVAAVATDLLGRDLWSLLRSPRSPD